MNVQMQFGSSGLTANDRLISSNHQQKLIVKLKYVCFKGRIKIFVHTTQESSDSKPTVLILQKSLLRFESNDCLLVPCFDIDSILKKQLARPSKSSFVSFLEIQNPDFKRLLLFPALYLESILRQRPSFE